MKTIVITGSTRGLGRALSEALLERGCSVAISGRTAEVVTRVHQELSSIHGADRVIGVTCDVRRPEQLQGLWGQALSAFGRVDIWVNNAGISNAPAPLWELTEAQAREVIETNLLGAIYGSQVAIRGMLLQGYGALYNLEGMGSDGRTHEGMTPYGTSKYALHYLMKALAKELDGTGVIVASLRPGMIVTDLVTGPYRGRPEEWERVKPIFNIIADRVETAAPWMADQVLGNRRNGAVLKRLSTATLAARFLMAPFRRRDLFAGIDPKTQV